MSVADSLANPAHILGKRLATMNTKNSINKAYDDAADDYATKFWNEIEHKNLDRILLRWLADQIPPSERILEIGSGPGEVSAYLSRFHGGCMGTDLSEQMIRNARKYFPKVRFEVQDFFNLNYADSSFAAVVAFYAIVNLTKDEIGKVLAEAKRVLKPNGILLFTFHVRKTKNTLTIDKFFAKDNQLSFYLYTVEEIRRLTKSLGFEQIDIVTRYPYKDVEYPTTRAYFILRKPNA
jgi:ubiquinone/menaquinone biosynthesis C-methylase UbiE